MTALEAARAAAEGVRALNHATTFGAGYVWPSDVDDVAAELSLLARRLPQALEQAAAWLEQAQAAGRVGVDNGEKPAEVVALVATQLRAAAAYAKWMAGMLDDARQETAHLTGVEPSGGAR